MLPTTTYNIPEPLNIKTANAEKKVWFIIQQPLTAPEKALLEKIAAALKTDFSTDVFCLELSGGSQNAIAPLIPNQTKLLISFGLSPSSLGLWIDLTAPGIRFLESFTFILTTSPETLGTNAAAKKDLWRDMQNFLERT